MTSHSEPTLIQMEAHVEKRCRSSSGSDTDSSVISNSERSQDVETDRWDFEETIGDKISDGNAFGGIVEPNRCEPHGAYSEERGGSVTTSTTKGGRRLCLHPCLSVSMLVHG